MMDETPKGRDISLSSPKLVVIEGGKAGGGDKDRTAEPDKAKAVKLTAKQEGFCQSLDQGLTSSDSYRAHYNTSKMIPSSVHELACRLLGSVKIQSRLEVLAKAREGRAQHVELSRRERIVERLWHEALNASTDAGRIRALELLGKTTEIQLFSENIKLDDLSSLNPEQLRQRLAALVGRLTASSTA